MRAAVSVGFRLAACLLLGGFLFGCLQSPSPTPSPVTSTSSFPSTTLAQNPFPSPIPSSGGPSLEFIASNGSCIGGQLGDTCNPGRPCCSGFCDPTYGGGEFGARCNSECNIDGTCGGYCSPGEQACPTDSANYSGAPCCTAIKPPWCENVDTYCIPDGDSRCANPTPGPGYGDLVCNKKYMHCDFIFIGCGQGASCKWFGPSSTCQPA